MKKNPDKVIVRKSYYTFSREYPAGQIDTGRRHRRHRSKKRTALLSLLCAVLFCAAAALSFFWTDLSLKISNRAPAQEETAAAVTDENGAVRTMLTDGGLRALAVPAASIRDRASVKAVIKQLRRRDCNGVILDFKARDGRLLFASLEQPALLAQGSLFRNETVRNAIKQLRNADIGVIARVFCFEDPLIAAQDPAFAVTYMDTQVPWLDKKEEDGGKAWLNPYSGKARGYLLKLLQEINAFAVSGVILESVCFPVGENPETATFSGESGGAARGGVLERFLQKARAAVPADRFMLVGMTADDLRGGNADRYDGRLSFEAADGVFVHTADAGNEDDPPKDYEAQVNAFSTLESRLTAGQKLVLDLPLAQAGRRYLRALEREGFAYFAFTQEEAAA